MEHLRLQLFPGAYLQHNLFGAAVQPDLDQLIVIRSSSLLRRVIRRRDDSVVSAAPSIKDVIDRHFGVPEQW